MSATKDKKQASANLKRAKKNLIEKINEVNDEALIEKIEILLKNEVEQKKEAIEFFKSNFGIWKDRDIDARELRERASKRMGE